MDKGLAFYNDIDPYCCEVLRKNINAGHLPQGVVDGRDIRDIHADELVGYSQVHLCAGIGGFALGLHRAGWPGEWRVVTAGWPCQPHSLAGKRRGSADERDLWAEVARIIRGVRPDWFLGENVRGLLSTEGGRYFGGVLRDLAACGYDAEWQVLSAAAVGAPHLRERVWIVAYPGSGECTAGAERAGWATGANPGRGGARAAVADADSARLEGRYFNSERAGERLAGARRNAEQGIWRAEPDVGRVAHGVSDRMDRLKAIGNALVPQLPEMIAGWIIEAAQREVINHQHLLHTVTGERTMNDQAMRIEVVALDKVIIPPRIRHDPEKNIDVLMNSIAEHGLLHPPTVRPDMTLVTGLRRLEAVRRLFDEQNAPAGWGREMDGHIYVCVAEHITDEIAALEAEIAENAAREEFSYLELIEGGLDLEPLFTQQAQDRMLHRGPSPTVDEGPPRTDDRIGRVIGKGRTWWRWGKDVVLWCRANEGDPKAQEFLDRLANSQPMKPIWDELQAILRLLAPPDTLPDYHEPEVKVPQVGKTATDRFYDAIGQPIPTVTQPDKAAEDELFAARIEREGRLRAAQRLLDAMEREREESMAYFDCTDEREATQRLAQWDAYAKKLGQAIHLASIACHGSGGLLLGAVSDIREAAAA